MVAAVREQKRPAFWTVKEVAEYIRASDQTVLNLVRRGQLKAIRLGRALRITDESLQRFLGE